MHYLVNITSKGLVTIPKAIRDDLGLKPSQKVVFNFKEKKKELTITFPKDLL